MNRRIKPLHHVKHQITLAALIKLSMSQLLLKYANCIVCGGNDDDDDQFKNSLRHQ